MLSVCYWSTSLKKAAYYKTTYRFIRRLAVEDGGCSRKGLQLRTFFTYYVYAGLDWSCSCSVGDFPDFPRDIQYISGIFTLRFWSIFFKRPRRFYLFTAYFQLFKYTTSIALKGKPRLGFSENDIRAGQPLVFRPISDSPMYIEALVRYPIVP